MEVSNMIQSNNETIATYPIVGFSLVKNEADIIESFIRHNIIYLDFLVIGDNGSTDATRAIIVSLMREGLPLILFDDPILGYSQSQKMTRLAAEIQRAMCPKFLVPLDADEFIKIGSRLEFEEAISKIPSPGLAYVPWVTYVIHPDQISCNQTFDVFNMVFHRRIESPQYYKIILNTNGQSDLNFYIEQGSHNARLVTGDKLSAVVFKSGLALGHFPVRSVDQLTSKAVIGWMAYLTMDRNSGAKRLGHQWHENFDVAVNGAGIGKVELPSRSFNYAQNFKEPDWSNDVELRPLETSAARRYENLARRSSLSEIALAWERSLSAPLIIEKITSMGTANPLPLSVDIPPFQYLLERFLPRSVVVNTGDFKRIGELVIARLGFLRTYPPFGVTLSTFDLTDATAELAVESNEKEMFLVDTREVDMAPIYQAIKKRRPASLLLTLGPHVKNIPGTHKFSIHIESLGALGYALDVPTTNAFRVIASLDMTQHNCCIFRKNEQIGQAACELEDYVKGPLCKRPEDAQCIIYPFVG
jgi:hypothetical protein